MERYEKLFERKNKPKYKIGQLIKLNDDIGTDIFKVAEIIKINEDMEIPDYYIKTYKNSNNKELFFWAEDSEILKKANSKEKQLFKDKKKKSQL